MYDRSVGNVNSVKVKAIPLNFPTRNLKKLTKRKSKIDSNTIRATYFFSQIKQITGVKLIMK